MIGAPALVRSGITARGIAEEESFIDDRIAVLVIEIKKDRPLIDRGQQLCGRGFAPQVNFAEAGQMREIQTRVNRGPARVCQRGRIGGRIVDARRAAFCKLNTNPALRVTTRNVMLNRSIYLFQSGRTPRYLAAIHSARFHNIN
jgi:hypothetical protein